MAGFEHRQGPLDLDLVYAPGGIERFADGWDRHVEAGGLPVCALDDIFRSKQAVNRAKDRESLPRLLAFSAWLRER